MTTTAFDEFLDEQLADPARAEAYAEARRKLAKAALANRFKRVDRTIYSEADRNYTGGECGAQVSDVHGCDDPWCAGCGKCGLHHPATETSGGCGGFER
jgi:hypothetical protein